MDHVSFLLFIVVQLSYTKMCDVAPSKYFTILDVTGTVKEIWSD